MGEFGGTFVTVGNATQQFNRLLEGVANLFHVLPKPVVVQHGYTPWWDGRFASIQFMEMAEFERAVHGARVLIMHGGAGSVINAIRASKQPIVMPRRARLGEHVDDHQLEFVRALGAQGKVLVAESEAELSRAVQLALNRQSQSSPGTKGPLPLCSAVAEIVARHLRGSG